jgi:hypothetical protein
MFGNIPPRLPRPLTAKRMSVYSPLSQLQSGQKGPFVERFIVAADARIIRVVQASLRLFCTYKNLPNDRHQKNQLYTGKHATYAAFDGVND